MATTRVGGDIDERFHEHFGVEPQVVASAPGRVNLIGEHTDYNEGFVLPVAIDRRIEVALARRTDSRIVAYSEEFEQEWELAATVIDNLNARRWSDYVLAVLRTLSEEAQRMPALSILISGGVPVGAGLSSSAALEVALTRAICAAVDLRWDVRTFARLAQKAENKFVGVHCGIMDQLTCSASRAGTAMLLDCRSLEWSHVPIPDDVAVVVMDTGVRRGLPGSDYNMRRAVCDYAVSRIRTIAPGVRSLRDVNPALLQTSRILLDATAYRRAKHVVDENLRPAAMAEALQSGDYGQAGALLNASHESLRDLYEVSSVHLDVLCETARGHPACYGARMTGAGFGGCAVALVQPDALEDFTRYVQPQYEARTYKRSEIFVVRPDDGVRLELAA